MATTWNPNKCKIKPTNHLCTWDQSVTVKHDHIMWCCLPHRYHEKIKGYIEHSMILSQQFEKDWHFLTKKISRFLFLAVEDILVLYPHTRQEKKITHFSRKKIYSYLFITVQTLFPSIKQWFYYISILKLIYVYYFAS